MASDNAPFNAEGGFVRLRCIKVKSELRVRIISNGYLFNANCQFPRDIRVEGREYLVPIEDVKFSTRNNIKFFYRVMKNIKIVDSSNDNVNSDVKSSAKVKFDHIYTDDADNDCNICMSATKAEVYFPCGHYCNCSDCASKITKCPLCRTVIQKRVKREDCE